jgi:hypothetical protein
MPVERVLPKEMRDLAGAAPVRRENRRSARIKDQKAAADVRKKNRRDSGLRAIYTTS